MSTIAAPDPTTTLLALQAQARASQMSTVIVKQQARQEQALADMLAQATQASQASLPAGQGLVVDRRA